MSEEVTKIIETLCQKLGVAASVLIPELAKYNIARLAFLTVIQAGLLVVAVVIVARIVRFVLSNDDSDIEDKLFGLFLINLLPVVIIVVLCVFTISSATDLIGWIASPTASAVKEITNMIK